jgi:hypothetical protein
MEKVLIATRGGLGDQIICNGIVNHYSENFHVILPVRKDFIPSMQCLYMDNPNVEIIECYYLQLGPGHEQEMMEKCQHYNAQYISLGTMGISDKEYQESMYQHAGLPFEYRYSKFRFPSEVKNRQTFFQRFEEVKSSYTLIHRWGSSGPATLKLELINPMIEVGVYSDNIFDWIDVILNATEIHCIPSSFFHLVDSILPQVNTKLFYHHARRHTSMNIENQFNAGRWNFIWYDQRDTL